MYELNDDEKQKIRQEEEAAVERERYRAFVRQQLDPRPAETRVINDQPGGIAWRRVAWAIVGILVAILVFEQMTYMMRVSRRVSARDEANPIKRLVTQVDPIVTRRVVNVQPRIAVWWNFTVDASMKEAQILGDFQAAGGWGDDVEVVVAEETDFLNWKAGHGGDLAWSSMGKKTAGQISATLTPGKYSIGISNKHSLVSAKNVSIEARLKYQKFAF